MGGQRWQALQMDGLQIEPTKIVPYALTPCTAVITFISLYPLLYLFFSRALKQITKNL